MKHNHDPLAIFKPHILKYETYISGYKKSLLRIQVLSAKIMCLKCCPSL